MMRYYIPSCSLYLSRSLVGIYPAIACLNSATVFWVNKCEFSSYPNVYVCMYRKAAAAALWPLALRDYWDWIGMAGELAQMTLLALEAARGWWEIKTSLSANCHREEYMNRVGLDVFVAPPDVTPLIYYVSIKECCFRIFLNAIFVLLFIHILFILSLLFMRNVLFWSNNLRGKFWLTSK